MSELNQDGPEAEGASFRALRLSLEAFASDLRIRLGLQRFSVHLLASGDLELCALMVLKSDQRQGRGSHAVAALCRFADENGRRILVTPGLSDPTHGTTSRARLVRFYRRFGFVANKGRNKDFTTMAGMYRHPDAPHPDTLGSRASQYPGEGA